jgi:hypothetical protein
MQSVSIWRAVALVALLTGASCKHRSAVTGDPHTGPTPAVESRPQDAETAAPEAGEAPVMSAQAQRLSELADQIAERMAELRELPVRRPIARGVMAREAIVRRMRERTRQEYPPGEVELEGEMLKRLGMIPDSLDYERTMFDLLEEQILGFYDPDERKLYMADWVPVEAQAVTMAHEITHALQDQHFDIARYTHHVQGRGDAQTGTMAVIEGDATAAMLDYALAPRGVRVQNDPATIALMQQQMTGSDQPRMAAAPRAIRETLLFPYIAGFQLCVRLLRQGGHRAIDDLLAHPPDSTEQVIHPEKLSPREVPVNVNASVPEPLSQDFVLAYQDVAGELGARLFFAPLSDERARAAAQGWGGDRVMLLLPRGGITPNTDGGVTVGPGAIAHDAMLWVVVMDAARGREDGEAAEFATAAVEVLHRRYADQAAVNVASALAARDLGGGRVSLVARSGRTVIVGDRIPADRATATVRAAMVASGLR